MDVTRPMAMRTLDVDEFVREMRPEVEQSLREVAESVNHATTGRVIRDSELPVRAVFTKLRQLAYERAVQMRLDAAEAAFSPSEGRQDRPQETQQGTPEV